MSDLINIPTKSSGDTLSAGEVNTIVNKTNDAITEQNQTKATRQALANKVDKVTGKGLSSEDYTTEEKQKLAGMAAETAATIKTKLESLEGDARLDAGAIKGLPEGGACLEVTYAQAIAAMSSGMLVPGTMYKITDRGDRGLFFNAITTDKFAATGTRLMLCPAAGGYYSYGWDDDYGNHWIGVWYANKPVSVGDLAIWGGVVWRNATGLTGYEDTQEYLMEPDWILVPKVSFSNKEYEEIVFECAYDFKEDRIERQWDCKGNIFGLTSKENYFENPGFNLCDISDWNNPLIFRNKVWGIFNNDTFNVIADNQFKGMINTNTCTRIDNNILYSTLEKVHICFNNINGSIIGNKCYSIENNHCASIVLNSNQGDISENSGGTGVISFNSNKGRIFRNNGSNFKIMNNSNTGYIDTNTCNNCAVKENTPQTGNIQGFVDVTVSDQLINKTGGGPA